MKEQQVPQAACSECACLESYSFDDFVFEKEKDYHFEKLFTENGAYYRIYRETGKYDVITLPAFVKHFKPKA